jgi:hypothetical protein
MATCLTPGCTAYSGATGRAESAGYCKSLGPLSAACRPTGRVIEQGAALRLGKYFGTSAQFWLNLQTHYDLDLAEDRVADQIAPIAPLKVA